MLRLLVLAGSDMDPLLCSSYIAERVARSPTCRSARHGI